VEVEEEHAHPGVGGRVSPRLKRPAVHISPPAVHGEPGDAHEHNRAQGDDHQGLAPLRAELEEPAWIVAEAEPDDVFAADPDELWRTVLGRQGGKFALIASMPYDPRLN